jgi:hypothetical protein
LAITGHLGKIPSVATLTCKFPRAAKDWIDEFVVGEF